MVGRGRWGHPQHHQPNLVYQPYPATFESQAVRRSCYWANHTASRATWTKHAFVGYESANRDHRAPNTTRSLKPNALSLSRNSISASSITTVIPKAEI